VKGTEGQILGLVTLG